MFLYIVLLLLFVLVLWKNAIGNLIGIALNLQIALGSIVILTILILSIQKHSVFPFVCVMNVIYLKMIFAEVSEMKVKVSLYGLEAFLLAQSVKKIRLQCRRSELSISWIQYDWFLYRKRRDKEIDKKHGEEVY